MPDSKYDAAFSSWLPFETIFSYPVIGMCHHTWLQLMQINIYSQENKNATSKIWNSRFT